MPVLKEVSNWYVDVPKFRALLERWVSTIEESAQGRPFAARSIREFLEPPVVFVKKDDLESVHATLRSLHGYSERSSKSQSVGLVFESLEERERACAALAAAGIRFRTGKTLVPFRLTGNQEWGLPAPVLEGEPKRTWWVWPESLFAPISFSSHCGKTGKANPADGLMQTGRLDPRPVITGDLPLAAFDEGFKQLTTGARDGLKIILRP